LPDQIRQNAQALAEQAGLSIEHLRNSRVRKEKTGARGSQEAR